MEIKCKLCGGQLNFDEGSFSAKCDSCGISQFIFDYLDKDSEDYDDQVEIIKAEKERFENTYREYADDVINADSYCLTSNDFKKIIIFFEKCIDYKDTPLLLALAKKHFIKSISSFEDCSIALKYIEEMDDLTYEEKQKQKEYVSDLAISFAVIDLSDRGYVAILPKELTDENILDVMNKLLEASKKNTDSLNNLEKEIVTRCLKEGVEYIEANCSNAVENSSEIEILFEIKDILPVLKEQFNELHLFGIEGDLERKISELDTKNKIIEQERIEKINQEKRKKRFKKMCVFTVLSLVILTLVGSMIYKANGYSADNLDIKVISKTNVKFNENLADGYTGSGYFYTFEFETTNNSPNDIELIRGDFEIFNKDGRTLSSSSLELHCDLNGKSTDTYNVQLNVYKGNAARELWNTELKDLTIKFRVKTIHFEDGTNKNYSDTKNRIIYPN